MLRDLFVKTNFIIHKFIELSTMDNLTNIAII